ncbi:MAG: glutamate--tRNA ligase family protein, partial [Candidatus Vogelbacteria bacterium]|nr:glutamate--tRNA ligase family protein [Candidatus Vogelbacteria bacterium]
MNSVITRFAPSPTGLLHAGNYRTAVFSYLYARQHEGKFVLRIEDTDHERSKEEYAENILESLNWLGLEYDNTDSVPKQSARSKIYKKYLQKLIDDGKAYISKEEIKKEGDRTEVIRFKNPNKIVTFHDLVRGDISTDTTDLGDFVIAKSLDEPIFHLAVVVDDFEMGITHVVRGEDHISNTPRQILIQEAIGATTPYYAHLPLLLAPDRTKLSKRKGALAMTEYRDRGYLPQAILNYMALLGWNPGTDQELLSKEELIEKFDLAKVQKGAAIFNEEKLNWLNREYLRRLKPEEFLTQAEPYLSELKKLPHYSPEKMQQLVPILLERIYTLGDLRQMFADGDLEFFFEEPKYPKELLKNTAYLADTIRL